MNNIKQVLVVRKDLNMRKGKIGAQCAHASMKVFFDRMRDGIFHPDSQIYNTFFTPQMLTWKNESFTKIVLGCYSEQELLNLQKQAEEAGIVNAIILDNGATEFKEICPCCKGVGIFTDGDAINEHCKICNGTGKINKPTYTCLAIGPDEAEKIDKITGYLLPL